jgi:hypothetical protein
MNAGATQPQGTEFQSFLYASVCPDHEGMSLSVLSALARQDVDPWTEAARLSELPEETAVQQIISMLDALPRRTLALFDSAEVARRLCALLPRRRSLNPTAILRPASTHGQNPAQVLALNWRYLCVYICAMLLMNWLIAENHAPPSASAESDSSSRVAEEAPNPTPNSPAGTALVAR